MKWLKIFSNKQEPVVTSKKTIVVDTAPKSVWRNNMWVVTPDGVGIIFDLKEPVRVHIVDPQTGNTIADKLYDSGVVRQALYLEIPECRRCDVARAANLGYL